jgi:hypothetical protein
MLRPRRRVKAHPGSRILTHVGAELRVAFAQIQSASVDLGMGPDGTVCLDSKGSRFLVTVRRRFHKRHEAVQAVETKPTDVARAEVPRDRHKLAGLSGREGEGRVRLVSIN